MQNISRIERLCGTEISISQKQLEAMQKWQRMYKTQSSGELRVLNLPSAISSEIARLVTLEMKSYISGGKRAEYLDKQYGEFLKKLRTEVEYTAALGGVIFKPYVSGNKIFVDCVNALEFYPTEFDSNGRICGAVFETRKIIGKKYYTKLEVHSFSDGSEKIRNLFFVSNYSNDLGKQTNAKGISEWSELPDEAVITNLERPLFTYFKMPFANTVDIDSPLGISIYEKACGLIEDACEQYKNLKWEFESAHRALYLNSAAIKKNKEGKYELPTGEKRLYKMLEGDDADFFKEFSPQIRNENYQTGLDEILRKIEFNCSLAYGTLSNAQNTDKTAEEIRASKQRSYAAVSDIQSALEECLNDIAYAMDVWCTLMKLAPAGDYALNTEWNDSILADGTKEFQERMSMVSAGIIQPWEMRVWYFGEDEETAKEKCRQENELFEE